MSSYEKMPRTRPLSMVLEESLLHFKVILFGLCNGPVTFERLMKRVLGQLQWQICLCYLHDLLIHSPTMAKHLDNLKKVFQRIREAHLKLKSKKCNFFQHQVSFVGHIVSEDGISTDPAKVQKIMDCLAPKDVHGVRSVLGVISYNRHLIPHNSEIAKPMIKLTEKERPFIWDEEQQKSFDDLKEMLSQAPTLVHPQPQEEFILDTDASNEGIGTVLSQVQDGQERVTAYGCRMLSCY